MEKISSYYSNAVYDNLLSSETDDITPFKSRNISGQDCFYIIDGNPDDGVLPKTNKFNACL